MSLHVATGLALLGIASGRLEEALGTLALQVLTCIERWQAAPRVEVHIWTALGTGHMWYIFPCSEMFDSPFSAIYDPHRCTNERRL